MRTNLYFKVVLFYNIYQNVFDGTSKYEMSFRHFSQFRNRPNTSMLIGMTENSFYCSTISSNAHTDTIRIDVINRRHESLDDQIKYYRETNHAAFKSHKFGDINMKQVALPIMQSNKSEDINISPHTILIASDSMLQNVDETRLRKNKYNVKVRAFRGSVIHHSHKKKIVWKQTISYCSIFL